MTDITEIACISHGRTGSTYICRLLENVPNVLPLMEIFSNDKSYMPDEYYKQMYERFNCRYDADLVWNAHHRIHDFMNELDKIRQENNKDVTFYKIFPPSYHLLMEQIEDIIFKKPNTGMFVLTRNHLKIFVSLCKAQQINVWNRVDTTNTKIWFDKTYFMRQHEKYNSMYTCIKRLCEQYEKPYYVLTYEELFELPTAQQRFNLLQDKFKTWFNVELSQPENLENDFFKQDKNNLRNSVGNYDEMADFLKSQDLEYMLDE